mgnify:CR=1 FL=1
MSAFKKKTPTQLKAYVGAGIMPESIAKKEVDEMHLKLSWLLDALDIAGV